jgi:predicted RNA-binding Zn ribbon-like protein
MALNFQFDFSGGHLCLDFANTSASWKEQGTQVERLAAYSDLLAFGMQAGLLTQGQAREIATFANTHPSEARRVFQRALELREGIYRIFSAIIAHRVPPPRSMEIINSAYADAIARSRIVRDGDHFQRVWTNHSDSLERVLWPIAAAANDLLTSTMLGQIRECPSEDCSWLFLDNSRNQSRRWCDMKTCGNRAKARRHYERVSS